MLGFLKRLFAANPRNHAPREPETSARRPEPVPRDPVPAAPSPTETDAAPAVAPAPPSPPEQTAAPAPASTPPRTPAAQDDDEGRVVDDPDSPLREKVVEALKRVYDPEIPIDVYELGLVYGIRIDKEGHVEVDLTLTSPHCPAAEQIPLDAEAYIRRVEGVSDVRIRLVWEPPWDKDKMSEAAKLALGID